MKTYHVDFFVNGEEYELDVPANKTALNVIRDMLDLTGAKEGCGAGECGACAMIVDGVLINGCLMLAPEMDGKHFETVEGFADEKGNLSPIQQSFIDHAALQCGYCTPGFIVSATALLREIPIPPVMRSSITCPVTCAAAPATRELSRRLRTLPSA